MFVGPVCHYELVRIARSRRTFVLRSVFGLVVLGIVGVSYAFQSGPMRPWYSPGRLTISEMSELSQSIFWMTASALTALVLGLTPALVADAIASERQRKTLDDVLVSQLNSVEIIVGKLAARLVHVGVFPVLVLPILSLLTLLGGIEPVGLVLCYAALLATAYFLAGLSVLASVLSRRPRDAMGLAYGLTSLWLFAPLAVALAQSFLPVQWAEPLHRLIEVARWVGPPSPLGLLTNTGSMLSASADALWREIEWIVGMELAYGTLFIAGAAWQLRPASQRQGARSARRGRPGQSARRWFAVRACTDEPVFWKEAYFTPVAGGLGKRLARLVGFVLLGAAFVGGCVGSVHAFREVIGLIDGSTHGYRMAFNIGLRFGTGALFFLWMLWLGGVTAASLSSEREQDTWISLLSTPLEARDILRGKMLGALRATAHFGVTIVALWFLGLFAGAVHPLGFLSASIVLALCTWFVIALGTYQSLRAKATWHARLWTQGIVVAPQFCCLFPLPSVGTLLGYSLWSYNEITQLPELSLRRDGGPIIFMVFWFVGGVAFYGVMAYVWTRSAFRSFDTVAGRPQQPREAEVVLKPWEPDEATGEIA